MRIFALILLLAISGRSKAVFSCLSAIKNATVDLIQIANDIYSDGMWFDKEDIEVTFKSLRQIFAECGSKVPDFFKLQPCVEKIKIVLENQDFMYYSVLDEEYDKAFGRMLDNTEPMIQMINVCVNSASLLPFNPIPKNNMPLPIKRLLVK